MKMPTSFALNVGRIVARGELLPFLSSMIHSSSRELSADVRAVGITCPFLVV